MYRLRWFLLGAASLIVIAMIAGTLMLWNTHGSAPASSRPLSKPGSPA